MTPERADGGAGRRTWRRAGAFSRPRRRASHQAGAMAGTEDDPGRRLDGVGDRARNPSAGEVAGAIRPRTARARRALRHAPAPRQGVLGLPPSAERRRSRRPGRAPLAAARWPRTRRRPGRWRERRRPRGSAGSERDRYGGSCSEDRASARRCHPCGIAHSLSKRSWAGRGGNRRRDEASCRVGVLDAGAERDDGW